MMIFPAPEVAQHFHNTVEQAGRLSIFEQPLCHWEESTNGEAARTAPVVCMLPPITVVGFTKSWLCHHHMTATSASRCVLTNSAACLTLSILNAVRSVGFRAIHKVSVFCQLQYAMMSKSYILHTFSSWAYTLFHWVVIGRLLVNGRRNGYKCQHSESILWYPDLPFK